MRAPTPSWRRATGGPARRGPAPGRGGWRSGWRPCSWSRSSPPGWRWAPSAASGHAERSLVADANRLAAIARRGGHLDLTFLLAAQGFRLAETPETQDGLLAALAEQRRAVRAVPFPGGLLGRKPGQRWADPLHRRRAADPDAGTVASGELPGIVLELSAEGWDGWHGTDASPTERRGGHGGCRQDDQPWFRVVDADGSVRPVLTGDAVGGTPFDVSFTADGRLVDVLVATPTEDAAAGRAGAWSRSTPPTARGTRRVSQAR